MTQATDDTLLISIIAPDRVGLVSAVTGFVFDVGGNLADTAFAVLGEGCALTCVVEFATPTPRGDVVAGLKALGELDGADVTVVPFPYAVLRGEAGRSTHVIDIGGGDRPGLVARMSEVLMTYGANIVRMRSRRAERADGQFDYVTRFVAAMPRDRTDACIAALHNTAGSLGLDCDCQPVGD